MRSPPLVGLVIWCVAMDLIFISIPFVLGILCSVMFWQWQRKLVFRRAEMEAKEIIEEAKLEAAAIKQESQNFIDNIKEEATEKLEHDTRKTVQRIEQLQEVIQGREDEFRDQMRGREDQANRRSQQLRAQEAKVQIRDEHYRKKLAQVKSLKDQFVERLTKVVPTPVTELKEKLASQFINEVQTKTSRELQIFEEEMNQEAERTAKRIINLVIDRFARPYCEERGIGNVEFPNPDVMKRALGPERVHLLHLEKICGVDISVNEENMTASVLGFDPVRRELGRASLEKMMHEKNLNPQRIEDIVAKTKRDLFKRIRNDGQKIAQELGQLSLHDEIKSMMGALRYRYSFAQNQYFHCGEVGWLCGLLSSELGLNIGDGKRAGLLHDIGKAMDHSIDGGHAVIGADFIEKHNEKPHVVHAVRAHHHDETPATDLAYLVIAADAISGARPGARRSTMDSYNQKMANLQNIASSFDGVLHTYILSAGREVRVVVDAYKIDDYNALDLSKKIAKQIEEECSYPGLIKVTVVRETQAVEMAR